jgi:hypothetical protein
MSKLKVINKIMIYWKTIFLMSIPKSNEDLRYKKSFFLSFKSAKKVFPFINHMFEFNFFQKLVIEMLFNKNIQVFFF